MRVDTFCCISDLSGKLLSFHLHCEVNSGILEILVIKLRKFPSIPYFFGVIIMNSCWIFLPLIFLPLRSVFFCFVLIRHQISLRDIRLFRFCIFFLSQSLCLLRNLIQLFCQIYQLI